MERQTKADEIKKVFPQVSFLPDDHEMREIMQTYLFADIYGHGNLDFETREFITLVVMSANQGRELLKDHIKALIQYGTSIVIIKEVMYQAIPYAGLLKVHEALRYTNEAIEEMGLSLPMEEGSQVREDTRFEKGFAAQCSVFPQAVIQKNHDEAPQELKHIQNFLSAHCFGDFYTRKGLDMKQRELLTFCVIASLGGCESQLRAHTGANLTAGNTRETLIEAITQIQPYIGFPRSLNALAIVNEICK